MRPLNERPDAVVPASRSDRLQEGRLCVQPRSEPEEHGSFSCPWGACSRVVLPGLTAAQMAGSSASMGRRLLPWAVQWKPINPTSTCCRSHRWPQQTHQRAE